MQWLECTVPGGDDPEELCNALAELGVGGMSIENERDFHDFLENNRACWDYVDEALEESFSGVSRVKFWLSCDAEGEKVLAAVRAAGYSVETRVIADEDWENNWKQYYKPLPIGEKLVVVGKDGNSYVTVKPPGDVVTDNLSRDLIAKGVEVEAEPQAQSGFVSVLLSFLHAIEERHGRPARRAGDARWQDRTLDLDLIAYGDVQSTDPALLVPHPRAAERDFVLEPWLAVDRDAVLPGAGRVDELLARLRAGDGGGAEAPGAARDSADGS